MQFIKTLFWVLLAVLLVAFSYNNWVNVTVLIWDQTLLDTKLPILVIGSFLLGFLPMWLVYRTGRWRMKRRIDSLESRTKLVVPNSSDKKPETKPTPPAAQEDNTPLTAD
ncbi:LapA family protein [Parasphingorhabdus sp. DH2-15]|jgi:uncharacterized membrane protein|uniref:LapA family protein n=1 Tax=Parasphingorhabdus sp. DH2-15 TaxID=3444112 RepID=UPI003F684CC4